MYFFNYTQKNVFEILFNQPEIRLYVPFLIYRSVSDWKKKFARLSHVLPNLMRSDWKATLSKDLIQSDWEKEKEFARVKKSLICFFLRRLRQKKSFFFSNAYKKRLICPRITCLAKPYPKRLRKTRPKNVFLQHDYVQTSVIANYWSNWIFAFYNRYFDWSIGEEFMLLRCNLFINFVI